MSLENAVSRNGVVHAPVYRWDEVSGGGYHLNGAPVASVLTHEVFPRLAKLPQGSEVADLGCGNGRVVRQAPHPSTRPYAFRGFDLSQQAVDRFNATLYPPDRAEVADISRLDLNGHRLSAALAWRSFHCIPPALHVDILSSIHNHLKPGASLYVAALSERDWKPQALIAQGEYKPGQLNDYAPVMRVPGVEEWELYAFRAGELAALGQFIGFEVTRTQSIQESTGYAELMARGRATVDYDYVEFRRS